MGKIANFLTPSEANNYHPPVLSYKAFIIYGLMLLLLRLLLGASLAESAAVESGTLMQLINDERSARNLVTLVAHPSLLRAAAEKSQDMIDRDYFAHVDPDGNYVWPRVTRAGYGQYKILGENLAVDFATSEGMLKAWLDSPTHRANLLHPDFLEQGLAALYGDYSSRYTNLTASLFGTRIASTPKTQIAAMPPPTPAPPPAPKEQGEARPTELGGTPQTSPPPNITETFRFPKNGSLKTSVTNENLFDNIKSAFSLNRTLFTLFGILLLGVLTTDSAIIYKHKAQVLRSHSSYHLFTFAIIVLISILIWWW